LNPLLLLRRLLLDGGIDDFLLAFEGACFFQGLGGQRD
jgi:hypothetical protein